MQKTGHFSIAPTASLPPCSGLTNLNPDSTLTYVVKTQIHLPSEDLEVLRTTARSTGRSVPDLVREAIKRVWIRPAPDGPVALWDGVPSGTSVDHDSIYDEV